MSAPSEGDLQDLLRLLTTTRKLSMLQAMGQVKALQAANLRSIQQIVDASLETVQAAVGDAKGAKALQTSCRTALKKQASGGGGGGGGGTKRSAAALSSSAKRAKAGDGSDHDGLGLLVGLHGPAPPTAAELERSLALPVVDLADPNDAAESRIAATVLRTNRAPLLLAFAVELLRYTRPEQPPSSRLSLAQAAVSANARTRAATLGLAGGRADAAVDEGLAEGQPRVRILGREVAVLKRGGYVWRGEEEEGKEGGEEAVPAPDPGEVPAETADTAETAETADTANTADTADTADTAKTTETIPGPPPTAPAPTPAALPPPGVWSVGQTITSKDSVFVARATTLTDPAQRAPLLRALLAAHAPLRAASHNSWAYRVRGPGGASSAFVRQAADDDGETGAGDLLLRVLRDLGAVDTLVVLTRWFGGTLLGPDRFRLMRNSATGALAMRLRRTGTGAAAAAALVGGEAVWALDVGGDTAQGAASASAAASASTTVVGMPIHRPEAARQYLLKSFATAAGDSTSTSTPARRTTKAVDAEREANLGLLLGALRLLFDSWADHLTPAELDRRAWAWYVAVRPAVDAGPAGWGAKGEVRLKDILALRRAA